MGVRGPLAVALLLAFAATARAADAPKGPWGGFDVGSWVEQKVTSRIGVPGGKPHETVYEARETLVQILDITLVVKTERKNGDAWVEGREQRIPRPGTTSPPVAAPDAPKAEDLGVETLTVDGVGIACKKSKLATAIRRRHARACRTVSAGSPRRSPTRPWASTSNANARRAATPENAPR